MSSGELLSYTNLKKLIVLKCKRDLNISNQSNLYKTKTKIVINILDKSFAANNNYKIRYKTIKNRPKTSDFVDY